MRKLLSFGFLAAMLVVFSTAGTSAQGQKGKGGQGGKGGFGGGQGGGFGMFGGGARNTGAVMLATNASVQEEIKATDEQKEKIKGLSEEVAKEIAEITKDKMPNRDDFKGGNFEELRTKMQEAMKALEPKMKEVTAGAEKKMAEILKPEQMARVKQITVQQMGFAAYSDESIVKDLKITDEQKEKIKGISDEYTKDQRELRGGGGGNKGGGKGGFGGGFGQVDPETQKKLDALKAEYTDKVTAVLNDEQKGAWKKLAGEPFTVKFEQRRPRKDD